MVRVNAVRILPIIDMFRSQISIGLAFGQSFWSMALVKLKSIGFVYIIIAVIIVKVKSVGLQTYCPLGKRICAVSMDPKSMEGPRYCPRMALSSGNSAGSWYIIQSSQPKWHIRLISAVSPDIMISGTCPAVM